MKNLTPEITSVKNDQVRHGGFSPATWVLGKTPNRPGDRMDEDTYADLGILTAKCDPEAVFARQQELRIEARKALVKVDCGKRVARAVLRKSAPVIGNYQVGDIVFSTT